MNRRNTFRNGTVHVCRVMCKTCIFRPTLPGDLPQARVDEMVAEAVAKDTAVICHTTLSGDNAVCRGFFEQYKTQPLQVAERLQCITFIDPGEIHE